MLFTSCSEKLAEDIENLYGDQLDKKAEQELLAKMYQLAHGETCRSYLARIRGLSNVFKLSVTCTAATCGEQVS